MDAHVLDDTQDGDLYLLEHLQPLAGIQQGDVLGGGDDDGPRDGHLLRQGQLGVAGARRQVDDQVVQIRPVGVVKELLQGLGNHRPTPDHGRLFIDEKANGHGLEVVGVHGLQAVAILGFGPAGDA